ncbi:MAG: hypothetical protein OEM93_11400 [Rhodospirillales bacterium]|nr:hypothetical protein [Rhodospirillales bacterium]
MGMTWQLTNRPWALILVVLLLTARSAYADAPEEVGGGGGGAAASDPTAGVSFQDLKLRYFNLTEGNEESTLEAEGSYVFVPEFKITHKLIGTRTNRSGDWETDFRELSLKPIYLHPIMPFGIKAKLALGAEWIKDLGKTRDGTGSGSDQIAPLIGIGWQLTDDDFVITLVQYFHSYDEDDGFEDVRKTGPRLIYIRKLPAIKGWGKIDLKTSIDHEDGNDFTQTLELQLGTMVADSIGIYVDGFVGDSVLDTNAYDMGIGIGLRFMY